MRLQASRIALCAAPGGSGPLKYEDQAWAELLVFSVPRPTSSSISGNAPEWRYLGPHRALPGFGAWSGQIAACTRSSIFQAPPWLFLLSSALSCRRCVSSPDIGTLEAGTPRRACCGFSFVAVRVSRSTPTARRIFQARQDSGTAC